MRDFLKTHPRLQKSLKITASIALLWLLGAFLCGFQVHIFDQDPMYSLQRARETWEQKGSDSYRMQMDIGGSPPLMTTFRVTVRQGQVVEAENWSPLWLRLVSDTPSYQPIPDPANFRMDPDYGFPTTLGGYTIPNLFDVAQAIVAPLPPTPLVTFCVEGGRLWHVTFDFNLGYLTDLEYSPCYTPGLLCGGMPIGCGGGIRISNLELLGGES